MITPIQEYFNTTNPYIDNYYETEEQNLVEDLLIESIQFYGLEMLYIPREYVALDRFYGEDPLSSFNKVYRLEFYINNIFSYEGDNDLISKFGLEVRNEGTLTCAIKRFDTQVRNPHKEATGKDLIRVKEGDLIYFPLDKRVFEVTTVENKFVFFQLGSLYMYQLKIRQFEFSGENIETGVFEVDRTQEENDYAIDLQLTAPSTGEFIVGETVIGRENFKGKVVSFSNLGVLRLVDISGATPTFGEIEGGISGALWTINSNIEPDVDVNEKNADNDSVKENDSYVIRENNPSTLFN